MFTLAFCLGSLSGPPCMVVGPGEKNNLPELSWQKPKFSATKGPELTGQGTRGEEDGQRKGPKFCMGFLWPRTRLHMHRQESTWLIRKWLDFWPNQSEKTS